MQHVFRNYLKLLAFWASMHMRGTRQFFDTRVNFLTLARHICDTMSPSS